MERRIHPESTSSPFAFDQPVATFGKSHGIEIPSGNNLGPFSKLFYTPEAILKQHPMASASFGPTEQLHAYIKQMKREKSELEDDRNQLVTECKRLRSVILRQQESLIRVSSPKWFPKEDRTIQVELFKLQDALRSWSRKYSLADVSEIENVPEAEKNMVIKQLEGYCVQTQWYSLIKQVPIHQTKLSAVLIQAALAKGMFHKVSTDPFFVFGARNNNVAVPVPGRAELMDLYKTLMQIDDAQAHIWRSDTIQFLHKGIDSNIGFPFSQRLQEVSTSFMESFLSSPARALLRPGTDTDLIQRNMKLKDLYYRAAEFALLLWARRVHIRCYGQQDLQVFDVDSPMMSAHRLHRLDDDDHRLDGKMVLASIQPAVLAFGNEDAEYYDVSKTWVPAVVLVETIS